MENTDTHSPRSDVRSPIDDSLLRHLGEYYQDKDKKERFENRSLDQIFEDFGNNIEGAD